MATRDTINVIKSQGDVKLNVDEFPWKLSVVNTFESARNDAMELAKADPFVLQSGVAMHDSDAEGFSEAATESANLVDDDTPSCQHSESEVLSDNDYASIEIEAV